MGWLLKLRLKSGNYKVNKNIIVLCFFSKTNMWYMIYTDIDIDIDMHEHVMWKWKLT